MSSFNSNIKRGRLSNYGSSIYAPKTKNTQHFSESKRYNPTVRGSFPKAVRWSLDDEGIVNHRMDYTRSLEVSKSARSAVRNSSSLATGKIANSSFTRSIYDGNAARKLEPALEPKVSNNNKQKNNIHAVRGKAKSRGILQSTSISPMIVFAAKMIGVFILFVAILSFIRVGLATSTVLNGISSQEISKQIDQELVSKNGLEVKDSALSNSGRIRQAASQYSLVAPSSIQVLNIAPDVLAYDENKNVSLVESLKRASNSIS